MALVTCPECGEQISELAPTCPHCGRPLASALTADAVKKGRQRSVFRNHVGNAFGGCGLVVAAIIAFGGFALDEGTTGCVAGLVVALISLGIAVWIAYGS